MGKKKKYDDPLYAHSCEKCQGLHRHVRRLHGHRLESVQRSNSPYVRELLEKFEANLPEISREFEKADRFRK